MAIAGNILWQRRQSYYVKDLSVFEYVPAEGGYALAAISNSSITDLKESAHGIIDVYDRNGTPFIRKLVEDPEYDIRIEGLQSWFSSAPAMTQSPRDPPTLGLAETPLFFMAGGARKDGTTYPFCGLFIVSDDSTITFTKQRIFTSLPNRYFTGAAWNANSGGLSAFFVASGAASSECPDWNTSPGGSCWGDSIVCLDDTLGLAWSCGIAPQNSLRSNIRALEYYEGSVYAVGCTVVKKSDGQEWQNGLVASISESGALKWSKSIFLSEHGDFYRAAAIHDGTLFAAGSMSNFIFIATNRAYGLALLSRFSLPAGEELSHSVFGGSSYESGFNAVALIDASVVCGGWTRCYMDEYGYQGWFVNIDPAALRSGGVALPLDETIGGGGTRPSRHAER